MQPRLVYFDQWTDPVAEQVLALVRSRAHRASRSRVTSVPTGRASSARTATSRSSAPSWRATRASLTSGSAVPTSWPAARSCSQCVPPGAGYDIIDVDTCTAAGVIVCNNSGPGREAVAEHALGFMLALAKKIVVADRMIRRETVQDRTSLRSTELLGKTLGIVGVGQIGSRLIELCAPFAMTVLAYDPYLTADEARARGAEKVDLDELLERSDFVHLNCPLTPETEGLMGREQFAQMRPTAFFITTARGPVHDEVALYDALVERHDRGRGYRRLPRRTARPVASAAHPRQRRGQPAHRGDHGRGDARHRGVATAEQWLTIFGGKVPPRLINPEVWPAYADRFDARFGVRPRGVHCDDRDTRRRRPRAPKVRAQLDHPVIDADGHWVELFPIYFDYIAEVGSPADVDKFRTRYGHRFHGWYELTIEERRQHRLRRPSYWGVPINVRDRAADRAPGPLLRQPRRLGHRPRDRVPERRADAGSRHRRPRAEQRRHPCLQHDGGRPVRARTSTAWCRSACSASPSRPRRSSRWSTRTGSV